MAAPTPTARLDPVGIMLRDGYKSLVTFKSNTTIALWEKQITPPPLQGGSIDVTTMHNKDVRTKGLKSLIDVGDGSFTAGYDPGVEQDIMDILNVNDEITITYPDGTTEAFWGGLTQFNRSALSEGTMPEATCTITATNRDDSGAEFKPVIHSVGSA